MTPGVASVSQKEGGAISQFFLSLAGFFVGTRRCDGIEGYWGKQTLGLKLKMNKKCVSILCPSPTSELTQATVNSDCLSDSENKSLGIEHCSNPALLLSAGPLQWAN